jgi:hypothetical protein
VGITYPTQLVPVALAKNGFADEIVKQIDTNLAITNRLLSATEAGGVAAIEQFLACPSLIERSLIIRSRRGTQALLSIESTTNLRHHRLVHSIKLKGLAVFTRHN